ncbi:head-to-tail stopper [Mycobacterium phage Rockstar]|uniref:Head-to-tail stopper n=2 Tax=Veracruzvirus rockstar TaxID=2003502 RepID=A0A6M3T135_9CAUD|nr:head closure Hc1 [Mycobacterium phage Rockstar]AEK07385.1 head-to-tail stopper [Mycobacterium phage Rockstar]QJD51995.1 head-to-tail stopper [Mycobacterium phage MK4]QJD52234.1 head-to-tail stopper [Mycobacterium phage JF2]BBC53738.1 putative head-to-tail connector protein [Mycobacterium phage B1]
MSLLDRCNQDVVVYPQEVTTDADGNTRTRPAAEGIPTKATIQVLGQSGTSSRRQEQDNEGFESERVYQIHFTRKFDREHGPLGMQSQIEWMGVRWALFGEPAYYTGSRRTQHIGYTMKRY